MPATKHRRPRRQNRKRRLIRAKNVPEHASLSCKRTLSAAPGQLGFVTNQMYSLMNTQLVDYERASAVGSQYQLFRMKSITITYKPSADTFTGSGGTATKPNLYYMFDKAGVIPTNVTLEGLKQMGARPRQLDEKNFSVSWKPSVLESVMYLGGVNNSTPSKYTISPWLSCSAVPIQPGIFQASGIDHLGIYWYCDQSIAAGYQYTIEVEVQFEFKKPNDGFITQSTTEAIQARVAVRNSSPDGVVGGGDGQ